MEERTSLLTGEVMVDKYKQSEAADSNTDAQASKKKKKKNKNKKKNKSKMAEEDEEVLEQLQPIVREGQLRMEESSVAKYSINKEEDDIESIQLEHIGIEILPEQHDSDDAPLMENGNTGMKVNNFLANAIELKEMKKPASSNH